MNHTKSIIGTARRILIGIAALVLCPFAAAYEIEMGSVTLNDTFADPTWVAVTFAQPFTVRPVVVVTPTNEGSDPASIRIQNVTAAGFEILQVEPSGNDGPHLLMTTAYLAVEPGNHLLPNGTRMIVIEHATTSVVARFLPTTWDTIAFGTVFAGVPAVVTQVQTMANESQTPPTTSSQPFLEVGVRNVSSSQLQVSLEMAETTPGTVTVSERIGIIALESGSNFTFVDAFGSTVTMQSLRTPNNIRGWDNGCFVNAFPASFGATPLSVASMNTRTGNNGGWIRRCSQSATTLGLTVDEDIDFDNERGHTPERAGIIAASIAFHATFGVDLQISKNVSVTSDPINGASGAFSIPEADMQYVIGVSNQGSFSPDSNSLVVVDEVPDEVRICVTAACLAGGPVIFDDSGSPVATGVALGVVAYSDDGGGSFGYAPIPDSDGFDSAVDAVQITLTGQFAGIDPGGAPSFLLILAARVN